MNGMRIRFETKPGKSFATAGVLPSSSTSPVIKRAVSSEVSRPRTISTSFNTGTGLKKCIPITLSGRCVTAASEPIGIEEVREACDAPEIETPAHAERRRGQNPARAEVPRVPSRALGGRKTEVVRDETKELTVVALVAKRVRYSRTDKRDPKNPNSAFETFV